jgi:hypothetical protein
MMIERWCSPRLQRIKERETKLEREPPGNQISIMGDGPNLSISYLLKVWFNGLNFKGLVTFGRDWKRVSRLIGTRSGTQIRSHA